MAPKKSKYQRKYVPKGGQRIRSNSRSILTPVQKLDPFLVQRAQFQPDKLTTSELMLLHKAIGNQSINRVIKHSPEQSQAVQLKKGDQMRIKYFLEKHPGHDNLLLGFDDGMDEVAIVGQLIENFFSRKDFTYTGKFSSSWSHTGDCKTLVQEFITIAREVFLIPMESESKDGDFFIQDGQRIIHKVDVTGNVDNGKHFYFQDHTWVVWRGRPIDILFGQLGLVSHIANVVETVKRNTPQWSVNGIIFYMNRKSTSFFDRFTTNPADRFTFPK